MAARYISDRFMPDKAIDLIDEAAARVRLYKSATPSALRELQKQLDSLVLEKESAVIDQDFERAARLRDEERDLQAKLADAEQMEQGLSELRRPTVTAEDVAYVVSMWTGVPLTRLAKEETERLLQMETGPARACRRSGRGHRHHRPRGAADARRPEGPAAPHRGLPVPWPHRCRQDRAGQGPGRVHVHLGRGAHRAGHVRVLGAPHGGAGSSARPRATWATTRAAS